MLEDDETVLFADGFDEAIVGLTTFQAGRQVRVVVYDYHEMVRLLVERDGATHEEAIEHIDFNVTGGYVGEQQPIFIERERR
jgi:hypothetical protein